LKPHQQLLLLPLLLMQLPKPLRRLLMLLLPLRLPHRRLPLLLHQLLHQRSNSPMLEKPARGPAFLRLVVLLRSTQA